MKRKNATRNALFTSVLSLLLCVSMLVGTTFAWFTDEVVTGMNTIAAGNLDVELYANGEQVKSDTELFKLAAPNLWEPGVVAYENLKVANEGTLALKYQMTLNIGNENDLEGHKLSEVLKVAIIEKIEEGATRTEVLAKAKASTNVGSLSDFVIAGELEAGASSNEQAVVIFWEPGDNATDNLYNANNDQKTSDEKPLHIEFGINLQATQKMSEEDSFGNDYDEDARADGMIVYNEAELNAAIANAKDGDTICLAAGTFNTALNLQGKSLTIQGAGKDATIIVGPEDYTTSNIPMQSWAGWDNGRATKDDRNVYALISANKDVTIKDLTVKADPEKIYRETCFKDQPDYAFVGIHVQSANATIENVNIEGIKPAEVTGNDHHNFGLYITSAVGDTANYTATYKNGTVSDVNRGGIYCWSGNYTLNFEDVTVIGPGAPGAGNGTLTPATGSENNNAIYAFCSFYVCSPATYQNVVIKDTYAVAWWGGASWNWAGSCAQNTPTGVTCIDCGAVY